METASTLIRNSDNIVWLTGAGISTACGIPDFRGPKGVWTLDPQSEKMSTLHYYKNSRTILEAHWESFSYSFMEAATPSAAHYAIARQGGTVITQNVDGLHLKAGSFPVHEVHGRARTTSCLSCDWTVETTYILADIDAGNSDPDCPKCSGIVKRDIIFFGEDLDSNVFRKAEQAAKKSDVFVCVGTSLKVWPVANLPQVALDNGASLIIVNAELTDFNSHAKFVLTGNIETVIPEIINTKDSV